MKTHQALFTDSRILLDWDDSGLPVWQDWPLVQRALYEPLLEGLDKLFVFGPEWKSAKPFVKELRAFVESVAEPDPSGGLIVTKPGVLLRHPLAPYFWATGRDSYGLSQLMLFKRERADSVLKALTFLPLISKGPVYRVGNWKQRDKLANEWASKGALATISCCATFQLHYSEALNSQVKDTAALVTQRWKDSPLRPGDVWNPTVNPKLH